MSEPIEHDCEETDTLIAEMVVVMKRALRLSREHPDFRLHSMDPFWEVLAKAEGCDWRDLDLSERK